MPHRESGTGDKVDDQAQALDYVPLPADLKAKVRASWSAVVGPGGKPVFVPAP